METRNVKTIKSLVIENNAMINIMKNAQGKFFFVCGGQNGYVSEPAIKLIQSEGLTASNADKFQFAECLKEETGEWIPQIMKAPANKVASFGEDLLHI